MSRRAGSAFILLLGCLALSFIARAGAEFKVGVEGASATKLHLPVRRSYLLDTGLKIRSVSVSDPEVAEVTVVNTMQLKITGKAPGTATVVYWTEANVPSSVDVDVWVEKVGTPLAEGTKAAVPEQAVPPAPTVGIELNAAVEVGSDNAASAREPFLVALLPVVNLTGRPGPVKEIRQSLAEGLKSRGIPVLPERELAGFMARQRMRYTGGVNNELAQAFLRDTGAKAVLVTSLEYYSEGPPPKIAFVARLVSTGENAKILWIKSVEMSGDDHPGILGIGLIGDPGEIRRKAVGTALDSLARSIPGGMSRVAVRSVRGGTFRPKRFFRSPGFNLGGSRPVTVAVVPFMNISTRKNADSLMELHFVERLAEVENVRVLDPGVVREELLRRRVIMQSGLSVPQADLLFAQLDADFLLTGVVSEYQDSGGGIAGQAKVGFSVQVFDMKSRRVVWSSRSYNRGDDGVFLFDLGEVKTAAAMASRMAWAVIERMVKG